jgi:hypothetical protein
MVADEAFQFVRRYPLAALPAPLSSTLSGRIFKDMAEWGVGQHAATCGKSPKVAKINAFTKSQEESWQLSRR